MKYISHRGRMSDGRSVNTGGDNKVESFLKMLNAKNCDGIEVDVQLSKDKQVVMFHDLYVEREFIKDCSYEHLNRRYKIERFEELMDKLNDDILMSKTIILDLKGNDDRLINNLIHILNNRNLKNIYLCSFNRKLTGRIPFKVNKGTTFEVILRSYEQEDFILSHDAAMVHWTCLSQDMIDVCRAKKVKVCCYTQKTSMELEYIKSFKGIDYLITDVIVCE